MKQKGNTAFMKYFLLLAIPMAMQNAVTNVVSLADNVMVTRLGTVPIAAVGLANQVYFVYTVILLGLCGGTATFVTQYLGVGDYKGIKRAIFINVCFSMSLAALFFGGCFFAPGYIMRFLSNDPAVIMSGVSYLKCVAPGYLFAGITITASHILKNLEYAKITLYASLAALIFNIFGDYALIFGKFGFPALGVSGAAIATVIARIIEAVVVVAYSFKKIPYLRTEPSEYTDGAKRMIPCFLKTVAPVTLNETLWAVGSAMLSVVYARISTEAIAAVNISTNIYNLFFVLHMGMASAAGVIVGKETGAGKFDDAYEKSKKMSEISVLVSVLIFFVTVLISPLIIKIFNPAPEIAGTVRTLIFITAAYGPVHTYNIINICGSMRTGGDVLFCMIADPATMWIFGVGVAALCVFAFKLPIELTYLIAHLDGITKLILIYMRKRKRNWIKRVI